MKRNLQKIKEQLDKLLDKLRSNERKLEVAQNRWLNNHDLAHHEHQLHKKYERKEAAAKQKGRPKLEAFWAGKAKRSSNRAWKAHRRAEYFVERVKLYADIVGKLKGAVRDHEAEAKRIEAKLGPHRIAPNKIDANGKPREALELFMQLSMAHGSRFYSQEGPTDVFHGITGPSRDHRHDCSSWFTSGYCACGLRNPNRSTGTAGSFNFDNNEIMWTGTLGAHGSVIREDELDSGDAILFGVAPFHHVEMKYGPMKKSNLTVGHGDSAINYGSTTLLPGNREFRRYINA